MPIFEALAQLLKKFKNLPETCQFIENFQIFHKLKIQKIEFCTWLVVSKTRFYAKKMI